MLEVGDLLSAIWSSMKLLLGERESVLVRCIVCARTYVCKCEFAS